MHRASVRKRARAFSPMAVFAIVALLAAFSLPFFNFGIARGEDAVDSTTLGVGGFQNSVEADYGFDSDSLADYADHLDISLSDEGAVSDTAAVEESTLEQLREATQRSFTVEEPDPVVVLAAVDEDNDDTVAAAAEIGTTDPLPTAEHLTLDTSGSGWQTGTASAYDVASSSTLTRSGRSFDDDCVTVAVPQGMEYLLGRAVAIVYEDQVVVATVTDTGSFSKYGRALDLGGGVYKAFGFDSCDDWGLRTVSYKFL